MCCFICVCVRLCCCVSLACCVWCCAFGGWRLACLCFVLLCDCFSSALIVHAPLILRRLRFDVMCVDFIWRLIDVMWFVLCCVCVGAGLALLCCCVYGVV